MASGTLQTGPPSWKRWPHLLHSPESDRCVVPGPALGFAAMVMLSACSSAPQESSHAQKAVVRASLRLNAGRPVITGPNWAPRLHRAQDVAAKSPTIPGRGPAAASHSG